MSQGNNKEVKHLLENVIDWAKKCLEVLRFQRAWSKGGVPQEEMGGRIVTTDEEQKLVEEIFNPESTFPTKKSKKTGFDVRSIEIEVFGPKKPKIEPVKSEKVDPKLEEKVDSPNPDAEVEEIVQTTLESLLPTETPGEESADPSRVEPKKETEPQEKALPPIPRNETDTPAPKPVEATPKQRETSDKPQLLVIDDYEPLLNMLSRSLKSAGYEPICAHDGVEGIVLLHDKAVDLIITDVQMPKLDGFDMSKMLNVRDETRDIPVIFLTEVLDDQTKVIAKRLGAADTIIKPFTMDTLLESVKTVLAIHKAAEETPELETASVS